MLRGLDQLMERKEGGGMYLLWVPLIGDVRTLMMDEAHASRYLVHSGADKTYYDLRDMYGGHVWRRILLPMLPRSSSGYDTNWVIVDRLTKAEIGESSLVGSELVQETTNKEKLKAASDCQKSYVDNMLGYKSIERDRLMVIEVMVAMDISLCSHFSDNGNDVACRDLEAAFEYPVAHGLLSCYYMLYAECVCCCIVLRLLYGQEVSSTLCGYEPVCATVSVMKILKLIKVARETIRLHWKFPFDSYACSDSLLLTPLCCDDIHDVTPRVSALAGCDRLLQRLLPVPTPLPESPTREFEITRKQTPSIDGEASQPRFHRFHLQDGTGQYKPMEPAVLSPGSTSSENRPMYEGPSIHKDWSRGTKVFDGESIGLKGGIVVVEVVVKWDDGG
ncbi:hypothetical protein Tco_1525492 [Tanacetum coccineum]